MRKDVLFLIFFSTAVFFGALFIFDSLKKNSMENSQISVRDLNQRVQSKINKRIQRLESKKILHKSKMARIKQALPSNDDDVDAELVDSERKYNLEIYQKQVDEEDVLSSESGIDKMLALPGIEDEQDSRNRENLQRYKQKIIKDALSKGWVIKVNDNLEVTSAERVE